MQPSWKSIQISAEACKKLWSLKENHGNSADAGGFPVLADQGEKKRCFLRRAQSKAEVRLAASK